MRLWRPRSFDGPPPARVVFDLQVDQEGWPPVGSERVWAFDLGRNRYRIDNAPWFVPDLAVGDIVKAVAPDSSSHPVFREMVQRSDHVTIRIVCFRSGPMEGDLSQVVDAFSPFDDVYAEGGKQYGMVALDIGPKAPLRAIHARLLQGHADGSWEYEESRVTPSWLAAAS